MDDYTVIVTGGFGFIGSALCKYLFKNTNVKLVIIDKLTYASNTDSLKSIVNNDRVKFYKGSIGDRSLVKEILQTHNPQFIFNLAAETHVDNSILNPTIFIETNVLETHSFIEEVLFYFRTLNNLQNKKFRMLHISTDEVYGDIGLNQKPADEKTQYRTSSPYSASKASSDHIARSYFRTYGLPIMISHCSNNYGPFQNKEKFIPVIVKNVLNGEKIPVYGDGKQIREWLFVDDHCDALFKIIERGEVGESYNIGSDENITNLDLIHKVLNSMFNQSIIKSKDFNNYIEFVSDRLGHDRRYAINSEKIKKKCGWKAQTNFDIGVEITIKSIANQQ
jgi:dTDP-glucose 4,6-dehydratase